MMRKRMSRNFNKSWGIVQAGNLEGQSVNSLINDILSRYTIIFKNAITIDYSFQLNERPDPY